MKQTVSPIKIGKTSTVSDSKQLNSSYTHSQANAVNDFVYFDKKRDGTATTLEVTLIVSKTQPVWFESYTLYNTENDLKATIYHILYYYIILYNHGAISFYDKRLLTFFVFGKKKLRPLFLYWRKLYMKIMTLIG